MEILKEKKFNIPNIPPRLTPLVGAGFAFLVSAIIMVATGTDLSKAFYAIIYGSGGNLFNFTENFVKAAPILLIALGVAVAFKAGLWNVGGEGQLFMGAMTGTWVALALQKSPVNTLPIVGIAAMAGGAAWALIPAWLKAKLGVNEIISTMMMNFIGINLVQTVLRIGPIRDLTRPDAFVSHLLPVTARYAYLLEGTRLHVGIIVAFAFVPIIYFLMTKTSIGYQLKVVGCSPRVARFGGINIARNTYIAFAISGALAGLAGMGEVSGLYFRLERGISPGYGFFGIVVAMLGRLDPTGVAVAAFLFAALSNGSETMQRLAGVNIYFTYAIMGLILMFTLASEFLSKRR